MASQYKPRKNGREYVDRTEEMVEYITFLMLNMPEEWKEFLTGPVAKAAFNIETYVEKANAVYIPDASKAEEMRQALTERRNLLYNALRQFRDFDRKFERLLAQIDLMQSEKTRLKKIMISLIEEARKSDEDIPEIRVISHPGEVEYRSAGGSRVFRLKLTSRQKDRILMLESEARKAIKSRIEKDNYQIRILGSQST